MGLRHHVAATCALAVDRHIDVVAPGVAAGMADVAQDAGLFRSRRVGGIE